MALKHAINGGLVAALLSIGAPNVSADEGIVGGVFSEGKRMGQLSKYSVKGFAMKSGEGALLLGRESTPYFVESAPDEDGNTTRIQVNPWQFSATSDTNLDDYVGQYVVIDYHQSRIKSPAYDTDYMLQEIKPVTRETPEKTVCEVEEEGSGNKSDGKRTGRIVKASSKGHLNKTFEVTIQEGNAGSLFVPMTIKEQQLYDCAVGFLESGKKVTITYNQSFFRNPFGEDTTYEIQRIEMPEDI